MHVTQDLNSFGEIIAHAQCSVDENIYTQCIYIPCVPHKNNCKKKIGSHNMKQDVFLNNHCQECVRAYLSIHDCLSFSSRGHDRQLSDQNFSSRGNDRQSSEQNNRKLISLHN
jgi:hypothetical protein